MAIVFDSDAGTITGLSVGGLPDGIVDAGTLATNSVDSAELIDGAVDASHMSVNSIDSDSYVDASIDNAHLADDAVGVAELAATGTASATTFLRGDNSWAEAGGGKVKQIQFINSTTQLMHQSTTETDSGWAVSITPTSASSKIFCMFTSGCGNNNANKYLKVRLYRDSTAIAEIHTERGYYDYQMATIHYMDAPSTTSATTYKITVQSSASSHQGHLGINGTTTNLTLMEVDA